ncbi:type 1 glutamine amidotransferase [Microlunatus sp. GCM10028923]|uniref:type 1 glutamine amidotransferase n=1 Tax=Microlunatus sp. GCM10028923 TaxID=3273400 RepID=UPI003611F79F
MTDRTVLVVQHVPWERPARLGAVLSEHGIDWTLTTLTGARDEAPAVETLAGLVLLGGPMGALDVEAHPGLAVEAELVRECAAAGVPMFGVCLGHQLIATALGAALYPGADREAGIGTVEVVADGPLGRPGTVQPVVHWHGDVVDPPPGATVLARSPGTPNQAYRIGNTVFATQFHLEADRALLADWLEVPEMSADLTEDGRRRLLSDYDAVAEPIAAAGRRMFTAFAEAITGR